jgi:hypothetical protein
VPEGVALVGVARPPEEIARDGPNGRHALRVTEVDQLDFGVRSENQVSEIEVSVNDAPKVDPGDLLRDPVRNAQ